MLRNDLDDDQLLLLAEQERFLNSNEKNAASLIKKNDKETNKSKHISKFKQQFSGQNKLKPTNSIVVLDSIIEKDTINHSFNPPSSKNSNISFPQVKHRSQLENKFSRDLNKNNKSSYDPNDIIDKTKIIQVEIAPNINVKYSKLEEEKMKWQESISKEDNTSTTNNFIFNGIDIWRFDFNGNLLNNDTITEDIKLKSELYHHGKEPDRPGYTIEELLHLCRSSFPQQRAFALNTLAAIIKQTKKLSHNEPVLDTLIDVSAIVYIRSALDDTIQTPMTAAINCLHALITPNNRNFYLDEQLLCWFGKHQLFPLSPLIQFDDNNEDEVILAKKDLIRSFVLKMNGIERLRYISESTKIPLLSVLQSLEIIERCVLHSEEIATTIFNIEYVLEFLIGITHSLFLIDKYENTHNDLSNDHKLTLKVINTALRIIWIICRSTKQGAKQIFENKKFNLFLQSFDFLNLHKISKSKQSLCYYIIDLLYLKRLYCFGIDNNISYQIINIFSLLNNYYFPNILNNIKDILFYHNINILIQRMISLCSIGLEKYYNDLNIIEMKDIILNIISKIQSIIQTSEYILSNSFNSIFECINGNLFALLTCFYKTSIKKKENIGNLNTITNITDYIINITKSISNDYSKVNENINKNSFSKNSLFSSKTITEFFNCNIEESLLHSAKRHTLIQFLILNEIIITNSKYTKSPLDSFIYSIELENEIKLLQNQAIKTLFNLTTTLESFDKALYLFQYRSICWNIQYLFIYLTRVFYLNISKELNIQELYSQALDICLFTFYGCESFISSLFIQWIFNKKVLMKIFQSNTNTLKTIISEDIFFSYLSKLYGGFTRTILNTDLLCFSDNLYNNRSVDSFFLKSHKSLLPLSKIWYLLPINLYYNEYQNNKDKHNNLLKKKEQIKPQNDFYYPVLSFCILILENYSNLLISDKLLGSIFIEISKCFLLPGEIYLDSLINKYLTKLLELLTIKYNIIFDDKYFTYVKDFVYEYSSSSFGYSIFTDYLIVFLQMQHPSEYRKIIWDELSPVLKLIKPSKQIKNFDINKYLYPIENDTNLLQTITDCLSNNLYNLEEHHFMYTIGIHHISGALFNDFNDNTKSCLSNWSKIQIWNQLDKTLQDKILNYHPSINDDSIITKRTVLISQLTQK